MRPTNLAALVEQFAERPVSSGIHLYASFVEAPAFCAYPELRRAIVSGACDYRASGVGPGTRVILPFETSLQVIVAFFALTRAGSLPLVVRPPAPGAAAAAYTGFVERLVALHRADFILATPSVSTLPLACPLLSAPELDTTGEAALPAWEGDEHSLSFVQFSSGSTAFPKGVPITQGNLFRQLALLTDFHRLKPGEAGANWLPLFHDMGLIGGLVNALYSGLDLHLCSPRQFLADPLGWFELVSARRVRSFAIPNFGIEYLLRALGAAEDELTRDLRFDALAHVFVGAEPINPRTFGDFTAFLCRHGMKPEALQPAYGMAEAVLIATGGRDTPTRVVTASNGVRSVSVGKPLPGFELRLGSGERTASEREPGEVLLRHGTLARDYFEHTTRLLDRDGFYHTGDIGFIDAGELFILGRSGERLKLNGATYYAHDFEHVIEALPGVRPRSCVVLQHEGELVALLETPPSADRVKLHAAVNDALLREFGLKLKLEQLLRIKAGQIRRTSSGKLQRGEMLTAFSAGRLTTWDRPVPKVFVSD